RANRGKRRGNGRTRQGRQDTFYLALRVLGPVAEAWQCRSSARFAADGVFAVLARCGGARPDRRLQRIWHGNDGLCRARTWDAERPGAQSGGIGSGRRSPEATSLSECQYREEPRLRSALEALARRKNATLS